MCENEDNGVLAWHATEPLATWVEYAYQLKKYLLKDSTKHVFVYGKDGKKVEYKRVTHGHWVENRRYYDLTCSECGKRPLFYYDEEDCDYYPCLSKFCPYCGNPLDEEDK